MTARMPAPCRAAMNLRFLLLLSAITLVVMGAGTGLWYYQKFVRAKTALTEAHELAGKSQWREAAESTRRYLQQYPNDLTVLKEYAEALLNTRPRELDHVVRATTAYRRIIRLDPSDTVAYRGAMKLYFALQDYTELAHVAELAFRPEFSRQDAIESRLYLARARFGMGRYADALSLVNETESRAIESTSVTQTRLDALVLRSRLEERGDRPDPAKIRFPLEAAVQLDPNAIEPQLLLSRQDRLAAIASQNPVEKQNLRQRARDRLASLHPTIAVDQLRTSLEWLALEEVAPAEDLLLKAEANPDPLGDDGFLLSADWILARLAMRSKLAVLQEKLPPDGMRVADEALEQLPTNAYKALAYPEAIRLYLVGQQVASERNDTAAATAALAKARSTFAKYREILALVPTQPAPEVLALTEALIAHREGDYHRAIAVIEPIAKPDDVDALDLWGLLADSYARIGYLRRAGQAAAVYSKLGGRRTRDFELEQLNWTIEQGAWDQAEAIVDKWADVSDADVQRQALRQQVRLRAALAGPAGERDSRLTKVEDECRRLLARHPQSAVLLGIEADLLAARGKAGEAEQVHKRAMVESDDAEGARLRMAEFYALAGNRPQALATLQEAVKASPQRGEAWLRLGELLIDMESYAEATAALTQGRGLATSASMQRAFDIKVASVNFAKGDIQAGNAMLQALAENPGGDRDANLRRIWLHELRSRGEDVLREHADLALKLVDQLKGIETERGLEWRVWQAEMLLLSRPSQADRDRAIDLLRTVLDADPSWQRATLLLGKAYELNQDWRAAEALYSEAIARSPKSVQLGRALALFYQRRGRVADLRRSLRSDMFPESIRVAQDVVEAIDRDDLPGAEKKLQDHIKNNPADIAARLFLVQLQYKMTQEADRALGQLDELAKLGGEADSIFRTRVAILETSGRTEQAVHLLDERVEKQADYFAFEMRGQYRHSQGDLAGAEADFRKLTELKPGDSEACRRLGVFFVDTRRVDDAIRLWQEALVQNRTDVETKRALAKALLMRGGSSDRARALELIDDVEKNSTQSLDPELVKLRALAMLDMAGSRTEARKLLENAVERDPLMVDAHLALIRLAMEDGDGNALHRLLDRALEGNPRDPRIRLVKAQVQESEGKAAAALATAREVLTRAPANVDALRMVVRLELQSNPSGNGQALLGLLDRALETEPNVPELHILRAQTLSRLGRTAEGRTSLERYVSEHPQTVDAGPLLALADLAQAEHDEAAVDAWIQKATEKAPTDSAVLQARVRRLEYRREYDELARHFAGVEAQSMPGPIAVLVVQSLKESPSAEHRAAARNLALQTSGRLAVDDSSQSDLGILLFDLGAVDDAIRIYKAYREKKPDDIRALNNLAWVLGMGKSDYAAAIELADRGLALAARDENLLDTRATLLAKADQPAAALTDFRQCAMVAKEPATRARAWLQAARCARMLGDATEIRRAVQEAQRIDLERKVLSDAEREELKQLSISPPQ